MGENKPIRIMIVDDHLMVRDGLKVFLSVYDDIEVVGEANDGEGALALCPQVEPEVVLTREVAELSLMKHMRYQYLMRRH